MIRRLSIWGFALAFAVQAALLGYMLVGRARLLMHGTEIRLPVVPVDPRDFFRGDYVVLSYPMSRVKAAELLGEDDFAYGDAVYVELAQDGDVWKPVALQKQKPYASLAIRGVITNYSYADNCSEPRCAVYDIDYNLEQFFVPEGEGRELESLRNDQRVQVDVAVAENGRAALKRLRVDGEVKYEEKLF